MEFSEKSLNTLELPAVLGLLAGEAVSEAAKERARALRPIPDAREVRARLKETTAARTMMTLRGSPSFSGVRDVRSSLARADMGGALNQRELLDIAAVLRSARLVKGYGDSENKSTAIDFLFQALVPRKTLEEEITAAVLDEEELADSASAELADIRRKMRAEASRIRETLQHMISSPSYSKVLQEPIITTRSDRFVIPVRAEFKGSVPGLVHDVSSSGATLFIEPMPVVKANNELRELAAKEKREIERILAELSAKCAESAESIEGNFNTLVALDLIFAKARLSFALDCSEPETGEGGELVLRRARHPLLHKDTAVPIDVRLGGDFDTLVITGPNTGGKTVTLKTLGLLSLMAECGLHIPASDGSRVPVFQKVLADIGDEQSIEQSLSTFSSHMINIVGILGECGEGTLLLFDELGAGTDPTEGAALAIAIVEFVRATGALTAATTHYAELKVYATNERGVQNASCEFDVETLRPTYRLLMGIPGKSNAFAISKRLGLPDDIIEDARERVGVESASFEATIEKLEKEIRRAENDRLEADKKLREAEENAKKAGFLRSELEVRLEKAGEKARRDAERILANARAEAEKVFDELDELRRQKDEESDHRRMNDARAELRRRLNEATEQLGAAGRISRSERKKSSRKIQAGDTVEILAAGVKATVEAISGDGTLQLISGAIKVRAREDEVLLLEDEAPGKDRTASHTSVVSSRGGASAELDIRGMETIEAEMTVERFIDGAVMGHLNTVSIIHGKGTGALREAVRKCLKKDSRVKSFRLGRYGEGETGVTIVELK